MKVNFKWDGKDLYTPKFSVLHNSSYTIFYVALPISQEKDTEDGVSWIPDDIIHNFESFSIENDAFIFKTTNNAFVFTSKELLSSLSKGEAFTGIVYLDENNNYIHRSYRQISFINE